MVAVAAILLLLAVGLAAHSVWRLAVYQRSSGVARAVGLGNKGSTYYQINYSAGGQAYTIDTKKSTWLSSIFGGGYAPGEQLVILYPPSAPGEGVVKTFSNLWSGPVTLGALGLLAGACFFLQRWQFRRVGSGPDPSEDPTLSAEELLALDHERRRKPKGRGRRPRG
jgi:hypothetical protein